jgi:hypothetical protein
MTASTTEIPELEGVEPRGEWEPTPSLAAETHPLLRSRNFYIALTVVSLVIGGVSLLFPSTPSYDPWSWTDWARGIIHLNFHLNQYGTSWKPLPMIATIPAALFGHAAPDIWLVVARAGTLAGAVMVFRLGYRLTRQIAESDAELSRSRLMTIAPALLAGLIGAIALAFTSTEFYLSSNALGYSEGLATALMLVAIERHLDGKPRQAFVVGFFVALDRPEVWAFWGVYGLWLFWRDRRFRVTIVVLAVLQPILWFLPVYWGSGHFGSSVERATNPRANSLAYAKFPFWAELKQEAWRTMLLRIKLFAVLMVLALAAVLWRDRRRERGWRAALAAPRTRALVVAAGCGFGGVAWFVIIAIETQAHFSGNSRYLVLGDALVDLCGAVGFGWLAIVLGSAGIRLVHRASVGAAQGLIVGACALVAAIFVFAPNFIGNNLISLPATHRSLNYQAQLRTGMQKLIAQYGGPERVLACGHVMTEGFQVPMVAYYLNTRTAYIGAPPAAGDPPGPAPNVILQTRDTRSASLLPYLSWWPHVHYHYVASSGPVHMFTNCPSSSSSAS